MEQHATVDELLSAVTDLFGEDVDALGEQDSLIERGLDSIQLMQVASQWRKRGVKISFAQLAKDPSLGSWRALLAEELARTAEPSAEQAPPAVPEVDPAAAFPLALMQHAYWIGREDATPLGGVAAHLYVEFDGPGVDAERLAAAVRALVQRHGMLRAAFNEDGTQRILPSAQEAGLIVHDLQERDGSATDTRLREIRDACSHQKLDVAAGEVFALELSLLPDGRSRLHVDVDMLAGDAVSYRILLADLAHLYRHPDRSLEPIGYSYPQYLAARPVLRGRNIERARQWWQQRVPELPSAPDLPRLGETDRGDPARVARRHHWLPATEKQRLADAAHARGLTPAMVVATAFAETISAWTGQPRFLLNLPMFDREETHPDVWKLVGDFTSSVLLDVDLTERASFTEHARDVQERFHADAEHADYSGVEVLRDLSRHRGEQVLAPIVFTSALNLGELFDESVRECFGEPVWIVSQGPQVLLDAQVTEVSGGLLVNWDVRENAFPSGLVDAMFGAFTELITRLGESGQAWESPVPALLPPAQAEVRDRVNATDRDRGGTLLQDGFFEQAARRPDEPALLWGQDGELSYGALADRALRVAAVLRERGLLPGETVAITLPKGPDQITAVLGVLAAGGVYVPIGVDQPARRRERIRRSAGYRFALTDGEPAGDAGAVSEIPVAEAIERATAPAAPVRVGEEDPAYVLFTSGSTGEPKGVEVPHRAAMNTIEDLNERFDVGPGDRCLAVSALDFDLSVYDLFGLTAAGGALVLVDDSERRDAERWVQLVRDHGVTLVNCVPALLDMLLLAADPGDLAGLRVVLLGGDWVGVDLPGRVAEQASGCRFAGLGGTTETAIHSTMCEVRRAPAHWRSVPYGTPLGNVRCRVVDDKGRDCPDWVAGELWIGGDGVALGYRADEQRTAEKFVSRDGVRWYRTGDLARYWPDGTLEFLGRADHQVKLRGYRVELGEVESVLAEHPKVRAAVAGVRGSGASRLVAAVAADDGVSGEELIGWARGVFPSHMVPVRVLVTADLPLTPNGKIDRTGVARMWESAEPDEGYLAPRGVLERVICQVWSEVLEVERVGVHDGFFALGGDSVLATVIVARLREALDTSDISVRTLFSATTVEAMAARLVATEAEPGRLARVAEIYLEVEALSAEDVDHELSR